MNIIQEIKIITELIGTASLVGFIIYSIRYYFKNIAGDMPHKVKIKDGAELLGTFYL